MSFAESIIVMFVQPILSLIIFIFLAYVVISWLFILKIVKPNNPTARQVYGILAVSYTHLTLPTIYSV